MNTATITTACVSFKDLATAMIALGVFVIPLKEKSKDPCTEHAAKNATNDYLQVLDWHEKNPHSNVGCVATDETVWFLDDDSGQVKATYEKETGLKFPETFTVCSSGIKRHYYLKQTDASRKMGNLPQNELFSARVRNQYVVGVGSIHPSTGQPYVVVNNVPIAPAPDELVEWAIRKAGRTVENGIVVKPPYRAPEKLHLHERNTGLTSMAGSLRGKGHSEGEIFALLQQANLERCEPPLDSEEIRNTVMKSVARWEQGHSDSGETYVGKKLDSQIEPKYEAKPFVYVDGDMFMTEDIPPREVFLRTISKNEAVFYAQSINQIFAWRGLGKTCLGFGLTGAFANAGSFLGWTSPERKRVVYFEGELPASQAQERWKQIIGVTNGYAKLITLDKQPEHMFPSFATQIGMDRVEATLAQLEADGFKPDVVFFDSISTLFNIGANEEENWLRIQSWFISLRSRGYCIIFMHHAGKSGLSRSHSKSEDMLDVSIKLEFPKDQELGCVHAVLSYDKARSGLSEPTAEIKMRREHSPKCHCQHSLVAGCRGDSVKWEYAILGDLLKQQAFDLFDMGTPISEVAKVLRTPKGTVTSWRLKYSEDRARKTA